MKSNIAYQLHDYFLLHFCICQYPVLVQYIFDWVMRAIKHHHRQHLANIRPHP